MPAAAVAQSPAGPDAAPGSSSGSPNPDPAPSAARKPAVVVKRTIPPARVAAPTVTQSSKSTPTTTAAAPPTVTSTAAIKPARRATPQHHKTKPVHRKRKDPPAKKHSAAVLHVPSLPHLNLAQLVAHTTGDDSARARKLAAGALSLLLLALASAMLLAVTARVERRKVAP
jgi:hypothetical protein